MPAAANSATGVHACLGATRRSPGRDQRAAPAGCRSRPAPTARWSRSRSSPPAAQPRSRASASGGRAAGRVAVVDVRIAAVGDHVAGDPARDRVTDATSENVRPSKTCSSRSSSASAAIPRAARVDRVVGVPRPRGVPGAPVERPGRVDVAQAAGVQLVGGRLHHHDELGVEPLALEQRRRARCRRAAAPRGRRTGSRTARRRSASSTITASAPFMSLAPSPCTRSPSRRPGQVVLRGHRVEMSGEQDRGARGAASTQVSPRSRRVAATRRRRGRPAAPRRATPRGCRPAPASGRRGGHRARHRMPRAGP